MIEVDSDGYDFTNIEDVIQAVQTAVESIPGVKEEFVEVRTRITGSVYFEGDYSKTHTFLMQLNESNSNTFENYNLLTANCGQMSWTAMAQSDVRFSMSVCHIIPNLAYIEMLNFSSYSQEEFLVCRKFIQPGY